MNTTGIPKPATTALLVIDLQERLMPVMDGPEAVFQNVNRLLQGAAVLGMQTILTEQYPQGLGPTCKEIVLPEGVPVFKKMCFSCMQQEDICQRLKELQVTDLIICGVEAHICVLKTALEAVSAGFRVHVVADAVSSRTASNKQLALNRMQQSGAFIVSTEMILFLLIDRAGTDSFKAISKLIR